MPSLNRSRIVVRIACMAAAGLGAGNLEAQVDPGPRGGPAGAGGYYPTLNANEQLSFAQAQMVFKEIDSVSGTRAWRTWLRLRTVVQRQQLCDVPRTAGYGRQQPGPPE